MVEKILIFFFYSISLLAYSDRDMDGVIDKNDLCPNTLLTQLVDINGCTIKNLVSPHHFDIVLGVGYGREESLSIENSSLQFDYYYKEFALQLSSSYFNLKTQEYFDSGQNNTYFNTYYKIDIDNEFLIRFRAGVSFPTYKSIDENKMDYSLSFYTRYQKNQFKLFGGAGYTLTNDIYSEGSTYQSSQNIGFYMLGLGYNFSNRWYGNLSYHYSESIYLNVDAIETASLYGYYKFNTHWFTTTSYRYGLSKSAIKESIDLKLGYYW
jgi:hypothetical protein